MGADDNFSNPVAPAGFAKPTSIKNEKLSQDDFRKLLQTPRAGGPSKALGGGARGNQTPAAKDAGQKKKFNPNASYYKEKAKEKAEFESKYKDRAKERREKDDDEEEEGLNLAPVLANINAADSQEAYLAQLEQTKYLGGDLEHTHLVKGLDYALLQKVKADLREQSKAGDSEGEKEQKPKKPEETFRNPMARRIFEICFNEKELKRNEAFVPGRMAYAFPITDDQEGGFEIPTTILRSKAEVATLKHELAQAVTNDLVINKLTQIFSAIRQGVREKKEKKRRDRELRKMGGSGASDMPGPRKVDDDEDIFGDVGGYQPPSLDDARARRDRGVGPARPGGYFKETDMEIDEGPAGPALPQHMGNGGDDDVTGPYPGGDDDVTGPYPSDDVTGPYPSGDYAYGGESALPAVTAMKEKAAKSEMAKKLKALNGDDSYAECYPSAYDYEDMAYDDSDGEPDFSKMDQGKKTGPSRFDYDDEEEWARDKQNQEALPKAAFQFGVKMSDGRATRRQKEKGHSKEHDREAKEKQKIDQQLNKIQQIWKRKEEQGGKSGGSKKPRTDDYSD
eukprot:comp19280_c0_seq1/m.22106 comp19280_c0_seq1/g.22106  ORF comp19280_c0_seq1/g.22106 comp19280_c0_seq1/m.22106 type:complete len:564 (-) comp19280_c0_seq1:90-1781(-)